MRLIAEYRQFVRAGAGPCNIAGSMPIGCGSRKERTWHVQAACYMYPPGKFAATG
jgi:hypothetical protein